MHKNTKNELSKAIGTLGYTTGEFAEAIGYSKQYVHAVACGAYKKKIHPTPRNKAALKLLEYDLCERQKKQAEAMAVIKKLLFGVVEADAPTD